jgi:AraC-like DNA-binding protein
MVVSSEASKLDIEPKLTKWSSRTQIQRRPESAGQKPWDCRVDSYHGEMVNVLELSYQGLSQLLFRNHPGTLTLAIGTYGHFKGSAGGRPFSCVPNRLSCLLLPEEVLQLQAGTSRIAGLVIQVPEPLLVQECLRQDIQHPDLLTLGDALPGQETLLLVCSQQLLRLASQPESKARARMAAPLEASMLFMLASVVGSSQHGRNDAAKNPQTVHVDHAMAYMESHMGEEISLNNLCKACHISARTLQMAFQTVRGRTPLQALQEIRLTQLKQLLLNKRDIREACAQVGLPPSGRMAANYKRLFGELPSQTRLRAGHGLNQATGSSAPE